MSYQISPQLVPTTGLWTPAITFATPGDFAVTYAASGQLGWYWQNGPIVTLSFVIATATFTHTTASGSLLITGNPFTSRNVTGERHVGPVVWGGVTKTNYTQAVTSLNNNASNIALLASGSGQAANGVQAADMPTGGTVLLRGNISFPIA